MGLGIDAHDLVHVSAVLGRLVPLAALARLVQKVLIGLADVVGGAGIALASVHDLGRTIQQHRTPFPGQPTRA